MAKMFVSPELELIGEGVSLADVLPAMGYSYKMIDLFTVIQAQGLEDEYEKSPRIAIEKLVIAQYVDGHELRALYDTEDGPVALYLTPVGGLAMLVYLYLKPSVSSLSLRVQKQVGKKKDTEEVLNLVGARDLLQVLMRMYEPPVNGGRHALVINDDGRLQLTLFIGGLFYPFIFTDEDDLRMPIAEHVKDIMEVMNPVLAKGPESWPAGQAKGLANDE